MQAQLLERIDRASAVVIECAGLDYVSSAGLRVFLMGAKRCQQSQRAFAVCSLQSAVKEVFEISGFLSILSCHPDRRETLQAISA